MVDPVRIRHLFSRLWRSSTKAALPGSAPSRNSWSAGLCLCLLAQVAQSPLNRLEPPQRAKLLGSLILLTIGGIALVVLAWLTLRIGRRYLRREDETFQQLRCRSQADDWASKPLVKPEDVGQDSELE